MSLKLSNFLIKMGAGSMKSSNTLNAGVKTKMFFQRKQKQNWLFSPKQRYRYVKLDCTTQKMAGNCLQNSAGWKFCRSTEGHKEFLKNLRKNVLGTPSIFFLHAKQLLIKFNLQNQETSAFLRFLTDASQICPYTMRQTMPTSLYTLFHRNPETRILTSWWNQPWVWKAHVIFLTNQAWL